MTPAPNAEFVAHGRTKIGDSVWSVTTYRNVKGEFCFGINMGGGQGVTCAPRDELLRGRPLAVWPGRRQGDDPKRWNVFWIEGLTAPSVASVEIVSTNCSRERVRVDADGVLLHIVGPAKIESGAWPQRVVAHDRAGAVAAEETLPLDPPDTDAARAAGATAPKRQPCTRPATG